MKVLLDVCTPVQVRQALPGHEVHTAVKMDLGRIRKRENCRYPRPLHLKIGPLNLKAAPFNLKLEPVNLKVEPFKLKVTRSNFKVAPLNLKAAPLNLRAAPLNLRVKSFNLVAGGRSVSRVGRSQTEPLRALEQTRKAPPLRVSERGQGEGAADPCARLGNSRHRIQHDVVA